MEPALAVTGSIRKKFPIFTDADDAFLTAVCRITRRAAAGDVVAQEEQSMFEFVLIVGGEVALHQLGKQTGFLHHVLYSKVLRCIEHSYETDPTTSLDQRLLEKLFGVVADGTELALAVTAASS